MRAVVALEVSGSQNHQEISAGEDLGNEGEDILSGCILLALSHHA